MQIDDAIKWKFPFKQPRENQLETIKDIIKSYQSSKKFYLFEGPTGSGKSVIGFTAASVIQSISTDKKKTIFLTKDIGLQKQYNETLGIPTIWSASNKYHPYNCPVHSGDELGYYGSSICGKKECGSYHDCEYVQARNTALKAPLMVTNYHFYLNYKGLPGDHILVADECHSIEDILAENVKLYLNFTSTTNKINILKSNNITSEYDKDILIILKKLSKLQYTDINGKILDDIPKEFIPLCKKLNGKIIECFLNVLSVIDSIKEEDGWSNNRSSLDYLRIIGPICNHLEQLMNNIKNIVYDYEHDKEWVLSSVITDKGKLHGVMLKPLEVNRYSSTMFNKASFVLMMSATVCGANLMAESLGIENYSFKELDSTFPIENRQVISIGMEAMNYKNKSLLLPKYTKKIDDILSEFRDIRCIIHTVSYSNAETIYKLSKNKNRMDILQPGENIEELLLSKSNMIVLSPSLVEGVDLKNDLSRLQLLVKVPYPDLSDRYVKKKMERSNKWYARATILKIIQSCGRSIRSKDDYAFTFILDGAFNKLFSINSDIFPKWFKNSIIR
jgi:Rad3-related DNA helicase